MRKNRIALALLVTAVIGFSIVLFYRPTISTPDFRISDLAYGYTDSITLRPKLLFNIQNNGSKDATNINISIELFISKPDDNNNSTYFNPVNASITINILKIYEVKYVSVTFPSRAPTRMYSTKKCVFKIACAERKTRTLTVYVEG